jgi:hypothetical protein
MKFKAKWLGLVLGGAAPWLALAQSIPNGGTITQGEVWSVGQWSAAWATKVDTTNGLLTTPTLTDPILDNPVLNITGLTQCLHVNSLGAVSGTGADCGSGGSSAFNSITSGTNTSAAMLVGTGATLAYTGFGVVNANEILGVSPSAYLASPPTIGNTTPAAGTFSALTDSGITGLTQCVHVNSSGLFSGTGADCGSGGGSGAFSALTSGTNTAAAMLVGTGASLAATGTGTIAATSLSALTGLPSVGADTLLANATGSSAVPTAVTLAGNLAFSSGALVTSQAASTKTGAYTVASTDAGALLELNSGSAATWSLPQAGTTGFAAGFSFDVYNLNVGLLTLSPTTSYIGGQNTFTLMYAEGCTVTSDGTNYLVSACSAAPRQGTFLGVSSGTGACATTGSVTAATYRGQFNCTGSTGTSTVTISLPQSARGYVCSGSDVTAHTVLYQTASGTSSCTLGQTVTSGDTLNFKADAY